MYKLRISVTQDILDKPHWCRDTTRCAVALAIRGIFPTAAVFKSVIVPFSENLTVRTVGDALRENQGFLLPPDMRIFISLFDNGLSVLPQSFEVEIPDWVIAEINIDEVMPLLENHSSLQLIKN